MKLEFTKFKNPLNVSLRELILNENFECVKLGVTKDWLSKNFPEPDDYLAGETAETSTIWRYGNLEFHFYKDVLYMIFTDYVEEIDAGPNLRLDPWILKSGMPTYFSDWVKIFIKERRDFKVINQPDISQTHVVLHDENIGPTLSFIWPDDHDDGPENGNPKLCAIHLRSNEYF